MSLRERLETLPAQQRIAESHKQRNRPSGWEPSVVWNGDSGTITTDALTAMPNEWEEILSERGLDPEKYEVVGDSIKWCSYDGWKRDAQGEDAYSAICYSFRAEIRRRSGPKIDLEALYKEIRKIKPSKKEPKGGSKTLLVNLSDFQVGNEDFGGVDEQLRALADLPEKVVQRVADLRRMKHDIGTIAFAGLGDLVENNCGFYPSQLHRTGLDGREQAKVVRRALKDVLVASLPHAEELNVICVPGNHGEKRDGGKANTRVGDNTDVEVFEQVAEVMSLHPEAHRIKWRIPSDEIAVAVELSGQHCAFTHGHVARGSGNAAEVMWNWWRNQTMGRAYEGVADADLLFAGHYHHFCAKEQANRAVFVCPSLTNVGEYFANSAGVTTKAGTLTLLLDHDGWGELSVI